MTGLGKRSPRKSLHWSGDLGWSFCLKERNKVAQRSNFHTDCVLKCRVLTRREDILLRRRDRFSDLRFAEPSWTRKLNSHRSSLGDTKCPSTLSNMSSAESKPKFLIFVIGLFVYS